MVKSIVNYHSESMKYEQEYEDELLLLFSSLLITLNDTKQLTNSTIDAIIQTWQLQNAAEIARLNAEHVEKLLHFSNRVMPIVPEVAQTVKPVVPDLVTEQVEMLAKYTKANNNMLSVITNYIESKYKELAVLENDYNYTHTQSNDFIQDIARQTENKVNIFVVQSTINNLREFIQFNADSNGYSEYYWHTQMDSRVRPSHAAMHGNWYRLDNRAPQPAGFQPGEDWGCRCWMAHFR